VPPRTPLNLHGAIVDDLLGTQCAFLVNTGTLAKALDLGHENMTDACPCRRVGKLMWLMATHPRRNIPPGQRVSSRAKLIYLTLRLPAKLGKTRSTYRAIGKSNVPRKLIPSKYVGAIRRRSVA